MTLGAKAPLAAFVAWMLVAPATGSAQQQQPWRRGYFPNVTLITQDGKKVRFYDDVIKGKVVAINFIFTKCPDVCPMDTAALRRVQKLIGPRMGRDVFFYSITLDPKNDTPAALRKYMKTFDVDNPDVPMYVRAPQPDWNGVSYANSYLTWADER